MKYEKKLFDIVSNDEKFIVMTAENRAPIKNISHKLGKRFIDTGITEQCMVGAAAGLALRGRIVVAHALASFLTLRSYEFIRTDIGIPKLPVKLIGFVPGILSDGNGPTHQAIEDISLMRSIPNMRIFCPCDEEELSNALETILLDPYPWYIRYVSCSTSIKNKAAFEIGKSEILSNGEDAAIITYGFITNNVYKCLKILESQKLNVTLINLRTLSPLDEDLIEKIIKKFKIVFTVEDHFLKGGIYSIIGEICLKKNISTKIYPISLGEKWFKPGRLQEALNFAGLSPKKLSECIMEKIKNIK